MFDQYFDADTDQDEAAQDFDLFLEKVTSLVAD
jgi:hypothetical protein